MKSIAALLLTIALALFPLSGSRAVAAMAAHAHGAAHAIEAVQDHGQHGHGPHHHQHAAGEHEGMAVDHSHASVSHASVSHASVDDHQHQDASKDSCAGDHGSSSCCSVSCHVMAPLPGVDVPGQRHVTMLVGLVALPLPHGVEFDGLLRPPRPA